MKTCGECEWSDLRECVECGQQHLTCQHEEHPKWKRSVWNLAEACEYFKRKAKARG